MLEFTKEDLDKYLKEVAKEYRRRVGKHMKAEIIIVGGGSVLINYNFRNTTVDVDALIRAASSMQDVIINVTEKFNLPPGWLNSDMQRTASFTNRIVQYSNYYKEFSNVLTIRTVSAEYLIAMKLCAGRRYKHDYSDVIGVLFEHRKTNQPITMEMVNKAVINLYDSWDAIPIRSQNFIQNVIDEEHPEVYYDKITNEETVIRNILLNFEHEHPSITDAKNIDKITDSLLSQVKEPSLLLTLLGDNAQQGKQVPQKTTKTLTPPKFKDSLSDAKSIYSQAERNAAPVKIIQEK